MLKNIYPDLVMNVFHRQNSIKIILHLEYVIGQQYQTDESECQFWECNNTYAYHNNVWNCPNGMDEFSYRTSTRLNCSSHQHLCVSFQMNQLICLSIEKANDGTTG